MNEKTLMNEKPADGVQGFFLYSPFSDRYFFRVVGEVDPMTGVKTFTDYKVCAEDIEVTIGDESNFLSLYEGEGDEDEDKNRLDWSSRVLGPNRKTRKMIQDGVSRRQTNKNLDQNP